MVESLKDLNKIVQKPRYKEVGNWMVRHILRDAALPITWMLLHTNVTANQVTSVSLIIGVLGIAFFSCPSAGVFLAGCLLLQFWYLLDHVDGQIARYRKADCLSGRFYDFLTHHIIHGLVFFGLSAGIYQAYPHASVLTAGFLVSFSMMIFNLLNDAKAKTYFEKLLKVKNVQVHLKNVLGHPCQDEEIKPEAPSPRKYFSLLHKSTEIHVLMNILTLAALIECLTFPLALRTPLFIFYAVTVPSITVLKSWYWISKRKVDQEFEDNFTVSL